jgi:alkylhydroperoxidase/carboxymuconolactone decarboxylase family protein YurZ
MDFLALMKEAGFKGVESAGETGFNSSPATRGTLFRAIRGEGGKGMAVEEGLNKYRDFFEIAYADGAINRKMKHLIALGASLGAGCEP